MPLLHRAGVGNGHHGPLRPLLLLYVAVVAAGAGFSGYASVLQARYRLEFVDSMRGRLFRAIAAAEWRHLLTIRQSDLLTSLTTNTGSLMSGTSALLNLAVTATMVAAQTAVAARVSPAVTALAMLTGAALVCMLWPLLRRGRLLGRELMGNNRAVMGGITAFLDGLKLSKAHGLETQHLEAFDSALTNARRVQIRFSRVQAVAAGAQLVLTAAVLALVVDLAVERFNVDLARLLVVAFVFSRIAPQLVGVQRTMQQIAQAVPAFDDLLDRAEQFEAEADTTPIGGRRRTELRDALVVSGVSFRYPDQQHPALDGVSLRIRAKHTTALVGPSGGGKTTLADIVAGLLPPDVGTITADDAPLDLGAWRASLALVPQEPFLWHASVGDNLRWAAPDASDDDLWVALKKAAADRFVEALPHGLDTIVGERGVRLSGGERQRIALARSLLRRPTLLILDEATSSLDTEHELAVRQALDALRGELTVLLIAHRLSTVRHADTIVVLDHGRVVEAGTWAKLSAMSRGRLRSLIDAGMVE